MSNPKVMAAIMAVSASAQAWTIYNAAMGKQTHGAVLAVAGAGAAWELFTAGRIAYAAVMAAPAANAQKAS